PEARGKHVFTRTPNATGPICVPCRSPSRWNAAVTAAAMYSTPELTREERGEEEDENEEKQRGPYGTAAARTPAAAAVAWRRPRWLAHRAGRRPKASKPRRPGTRRRRHKCTITQSDPGQNDIRQEHEILRRPT
ncbi:unnamed protein product, partial [Prorocentrum cordatum]